MGLGLGVPSTLLFSVQVCRQVEFSVNFSANFSVSFSPLEDAATAGNYLSHWHISFSIDMSILGNERIFIHDFTSS